MATKFATPEEFVTTWQTSNTIIEVAKKLNRNINTVSTRAKNYRVEGIPLKKFTNVRHPKNLKFGIRTTSGIIGKHRSRKGLPVTRVNIKTLTRLAKQLSK